MSGVEMTGTGPAVIAPHAMRGDWLARPRLLIAGAALGLTALAVPFLGSDYTVTLATEILISGILATGVNVLIGYTGLVSLGHSMFFGLGGYGLAVAVVKLGLPLWIAIPLTLAVVAVISAGIGAICTRTRGVEFLLITLAFSQMIYGAAVKLTWTGGSDGMTGIPRPELDWIGLSADDPVVFYGYALLVAVVTLLIVHRIVTSPFGSVLVAIRENETRAVAMGYNVWSYKIGAFVLSGAVAAVAGILQCQYLYFVNPDGMSWQLSGEAVLMVNMGGRQAFLGPLVGAGFFVAVKQALSAVTDEYLIFFGLFFMVVVAFFKGGLIGILNRLSGGGR